MSVKFAKEVNVFSSTHQVSQEGHEPFAKPSFESIAASFLSLADMKMSETQKYVLRASAKLLKHYDLTVTALADLVSRKTSVAYSTVKWNLRSLMDIGLISGGDMENRGQLAQLTAPAKMLAHFLEERHREGHKNQP